jgi:general secretion pathway protein C
MRLPISQRVFRRAPAQGGAGTRAIAYSIADIAMIGALAVATATLIWTILTPAGPMGQWQSGPAAITADEGVLARFDPFGRLGGDSNAPAVVTSLSVKLFGIRLDGATGQGSAIIAGPDGVQQSIGVGEDVVPGVKLKSVRIDGVTLDRGGTEEQIFLDQSTAAPAGTTPNVALPAIAQPGEVSSPATSSALSAQRPMSGQLPAPGSQAATTVAQ